MTKQGDCPKCEYEGCLTYGEIKRDDQNLGYTFTCDVCGAKGIEWYFLEYLKSTIEEEGG